MAHNFVKPFDITQAHEGLGNGWIGSNLKGSMAKWMGYPQMRPDPFDWKLNIPVNPNDRIGLFGRDMAALVI
jgi:hypothetical protein